MIAHDKEELSGQQIGNYEIVSLMAEHKVSDLFLARDVKLERLVYLEVLRTTLEEESGLASRFQKRMEAISHLKHENIASVTDIDVTDDGRPYAVIDYFPGITLEQRLDDLRDDNRLLSPIEALELGRELTQGLAAAHAAELIHHDLRPCNILLREDGVPVWVDFGVPVTTTPRASVLGKTDDAMLDYASPEELEGKALTRRSNIYSLGVILYELLAGHRPKMPSLPFDIFPQANMPKEEPLEDARPGLAGETYRLVRNCLWRQEWSRFETADEMLTAIETAIFAEQELPKAAAWTPNRSRSLVFLIPVAVIALGALSFLFVRAIRGSADGGDPVATVVVATPDGGEVIAIVPGETTEPTEEGPTATASATATLEVPTESPPLDLSISVLAPAANREFGPLETINFDWFWPALPAQGRHFTVYLLDGDAEIVLGSLTEPNNGQAYRLSVAVADLPTESLEAAWQIRLEAIGGDEVFVTSDVTPLRLLPPAPSATPTATGTPEPTATSASSICVVLPPPGWNIYVVVRGDALAGLAQARNVPVGTVMRVNCLTSDLLSVGQQLWLPGPPSTATPAFSLTPAPPPPTSVPQPPTATPGSGGGQPTSVPPSPTSPPPTQQPTEEPTEAPTATLPPP
jgi:serine/threonine protein kinase/LysM repeat protein